MEGTIQCTANYVPLTPITFLDRSAVVYRDNLSIIYNDVTYTWSQTHQRCIKLASSISQLGVSPRDVVCSILYSFYWLSFFVYLLIFDCTRLFFLGVLILKLFLGLNKLEAKIGQKLKFFIFESHDNFLFFKILITFCPPNNRTTIP
jgi:hypothetical protein